MSDVWNKMIAELSNLSETISEKSEKYFNIAVEKGGELTKKGKIQFEIESSKRELRKELIQFANFVADNAIKRNVTDFTFNDQFQVYTDKIHNLRQVIVSLENEKQSVNKKSEEESPKASENSKEATNSTSEQIDFNL